MIKRHLWTYFILAFCLLIALLSGIGSNIQSLEPLLIIQVEFVGNQAWYSRNFIEGINGQWWRLITPAIIHFGILHLVFNLMWWWELGHLLERHYGTFVFMLMFLVLAVGSNMAQFLSTGPFFGGLSGVVYGLLAFIYARGIGDQDYFQLEKGLVWFLLAWYVLCWTGLVGNVANIAHTAGLVLGFLFGITANGVNRYLIKRR